MKIKRTFFSCLMALALVCVCLLILPTEAQAASESDLTFTLNADGESYSVTACNTSASGNLVIPATYQDYPITSIEESAFYMCRDLTSVTIPGTVSVIGRNAFHYCTGLTSVSLREGVTKISDFAFEGCTKLKYIFIPSSVTVIGRWAFSCCESITEVDYGYVNYIIADGEAILNDCSEYASGSLIIPDTICGYPVTTIGVGAFSFCRDLTEITIPNNITTIRNSAFFRCTSLIDITIGNNVTLIDEKAFADCDKLTEITIPDSVTIINPDAFSSCDNLTRVSIGNNVTTIGIGAFEDCHNLTDVTFGNSVTYIGDQAFGSCLCLRKIEIPNSVTTIGTYAFYNCSNLSNVIVGNGVTTIGSCTFDGCSNLINISLGNSITEISSNAFRFCNKLQNIYYAGNESQWNSLTIDNSDLMNATIHYNHVHDYTMFPPIHSDATCTQEGYTEYRCVYGDTYRIVTSYPLWHDFSGKVTIIPPTCDAQGYTETKCIRCSETTKTDYTDSLGHKMVYAPATAPTCGTAGCTEGTVCERCGEMGVGMILPATGNHSYSNTWDTTCNTCGGKRTVSLSNTAPTSFKATLTGYNDVKLTWKAGKGANRYYVYYRRAGKADWKRAATTTGLTYTIKDLVANGKYEFKVVSYLKDSSGTYEGASTSVLTCSTTRNLKAPSKVTLKLYGYDDVKLSWSKVTYANGYKVYYKRSTAKSYSYVGFTTGTSIKKANLSDGVKYTFKVVPCTKVNGSYFADDSSKTASITTLKTVSTPKVTKYTSSKVKVSWTDISGESGYQIIVTSDKAGKKVITSTATTGKSKVVSTKKGKTYYYKVRAYKTVDGKKIYAPWSKVKAYKLK